MNIAYQAPTHEEIASALAAIPAEDRELWVRMGMAVKSELGEDGFSLWNDWSQGASSYQATAAITTWRSIKAGGMVTIASLFREAKLHGWTTANTYNPPDAAAHQRRAAQRLAETEAAMQQQAEGQARAKAQAQQDLAAASAEIAALQAHPYVVSKGIVPHGAKLLCNLVILPMYDANGELVNLQRINRQGKKRFATGGQVKGTYLMIGEMVASTEQVLACEGWATGCSLHQATGHPVAVAWNAGNLPTVAAILSKSHPTAALVVCGDNDASATGQQAAEKAASVHPLGSWCIPHFTAEHHPAQAQGNQTTPPSDFNDLHQLAGIEAVMQQLKSVHTPTERTPLEPEIPQLSPFHGAVVKRGEQEEQTPATLGAPRFARSSIVKSKEEHKKMEEQNEAQSVQPAVKSHHGFSVVQGEKYRRDGVYWLDPSDDNASPFWLCAPLHIVAETRDASQSNWGRLLKWADNDGHQHSWACPIELLASTDAAEFRKELASKGLLIGNGYKARQKLVDYVTTYPPQVNDRMRCVNRIGWYGNSYVFPNNVIGGNGGVIYQGLGRDDFSQSGTLAEWQQHIAGLAAGNSRIVFTLSAAFAGVLAGMAGESGGGFHYVGATSKGKTSTLLHPAASVWGSPERFAKTWRTTCNALEGSCTSRNDNVLILDELAQALPQEVGSAVYLFANGQGKARMAKHGGNRPTDDFRVMVISAGEIELQQHMATAGKQAKGGQLARFPAIPADAGAGMGAVETLHHCADGQTYSDHMKDACGRYYGVAGVAFLQALTNEHTLSHVRATITAEVRTLQAQFAIPTGAAPEVGRVAFRFALVAYAGELATAYGVTGWQQGEALNAAKACFTAWFEANDAGEASDDKALMQRVTDYMQEHAATRFPPHNANSEQLSKSFNRAGFSHFKGDSAEEYWVQTSAFKNDLCKGYSHKAAVTLLVNAGILQPGNTTVKNGKETQLSTQKKRIQGLGTTMNFYVFNKSVLECDG